MHNVIDMNTARHKKLAEEVAHRMPGVGKRLLVQGRTQTIHNLQDRGRRDNVSVQTILDILKEGRERPGVPVRVGGMLDSYPQTDHVREIFEETGPSPWVSVGGRAEDALKQLPTAQILPFKRPASN